MEPLGSRVEQERCSVQKQFGVEKCKWSPFSPRSNFQIRLCLLEKREGKRRSRHFTSFLWPAEKISEGKVDFFSCLVGDKQEKCHRISVA